MGFWCRYRRKSQKTIKDGATLRLHLRTFPTSSPPAGSTGTLGATRCERYTHTLCKNRESPASPTQGFAAETSLLKRSPALWLLSKTSISAPFSSSSLLLFLDPSLGRGFCAYIHFYHAEFFTKGLFSPLSLSLSHTHVHTELTFSRKRSHFRSLALLSSSTIFVSVFRSSSLLSSPSQSYFPSLLIPLHFAPSLPSLLPLLSI